MAQTIAFERLRVPLREWPVAAAAVVHLVAAILQCREAPLVEQLDPRQFAARLSPPVDRQFELADRLLRLVDRLVVPLIHQYRKAIGTVAVAVFAGSRMPIVRSAKLEGNFAGLVELRF